MASRYTDTKPFDYCINPRTIFQNGERRVVPCGRCNGCLLHKANSWSMRLKNELDSAFVSVWFTLTYNNKYLPVLRFDDSNPDAVGYYSDADSNIRFDGKNDVPRKDGIFIPQMLPFNRYRPKNYPCSGCFIGYSSKRDFQLFLKLLRKKIYERFSNSSESYHFRYYAISEYGPTYFRPHIHGLLFFDSFEVADFCRKSAIFESWKMCDKTLFDTHTTFADSGVSGYLTNYITSFSDIPKFFVDRQIKPFRFASKGAAIGFNSFDKEEFFEKIIDGDLRYSKRVERLGVQSLCQYPPNFILSCFPKCFQFSKLSFGRLLEVYGFLYTNVRERKLPYLACHRRLSSFVHSSDAYAALRCYQYCERYGMSVFHYCYLLDLVHYRVAMASLKRQYEYLSHVVDLSQAFVYYENLVELCYDFIETKSEHLALTLCYFLEGFGFRLEDLTLDFVSALLHCEPQGLSLYRKELDEIVKDCIKLPKFNEEFGLAPHSV